MRAFAGPVGAGIEPLRTSGIALSTAFEKTAATVGESDWPLTAIEWHALDEPLLFESAEAAIAHVERRITLIVAIAVADQLALGSPREIQIAREDIARVDGAPTVLAIACVCVALARFPVGPVIVSRC